MTCTRHSFGRRLRPRNDRAGKAPHALPLLGGRDACRSRDPHHGRRRYHVRSPRQGPGRGDPHHLLGPALQRAIRQLFAPATPDQGGAADPDRDRPFAWVQGRHLEYRGRGAIHHRRDLRGGLRACLLAVRKPADLSRHGHSGADRWLGLGDDPRHSQDTLPHQRNPRLAVAGLRGRGDPGLGGDELAQEPRRDGLSGKPEPLTPSRHRQPGTDRRDGHALGRSGRLHRGDRGLRSDEPACAGLPDPAGRSGPARGPLRGRRSEPAGPALPRDLRRAGRCGRPFRGIGPCRPDLDRFQRGLRVYRDHRGLPRAAASGRHPACGPLDGADLYRRRAGAADARHSGPRDPGVPGHAPVLPARARRAVELPHPPETDGGSLMLIDPVTLVVALIIASTPVLLAAIGELVVEKTGVLNLGVEGMMIIGAVTGFSVAVETGSVTLAFLAGMAGGMVLSALFAILTQVLLSNHVATGLALTLFGIGLAALLGVGYPGSTPPRVPDVFPQALQDIPVAGPILFGHSAMIYIAVIIVAAVWYVLRHTRTGLILRAVGESHDAAHALGYKVIRIRILAILFGGACAGLGGAFLSVARVQNWIEGMTAGAGWIALALVVFASWKPWRVLFGAYLFGGISALQLRLQAAEVNVPVALLDSSPYIVTIIVLVLISSDRARAALNAPAALGKVFHASG